MSDFVTVCAKDIVPGDVLVLPWELQSNLVVSVTEYKGSVKIETESDFWIGSENKTFTVSRKV